MFEVVTATTTIVALIAGPVLAVWISKWSDNRRMKRERKMDVFRTLMRTRRTPTWPDHVGALNLVEIEFQDDTVVITALKKLFTHFATVQPRTPEEDAPDSLTSEERNSRDNKYFVRLGQERQALLAKLLHAIAKNLKFEIEQLEIFEGGYTPQGWTDTELENWAIRRLFVDLYQGRRGLPIDVISFVEANQSAQAARQGAEINPPDGGAPPDVESIIPTIKE